MSPAPQPHQLRPCSDCPLWPPHTQTGFPTLEKVEACIRHVLEPVRQWLTAEEFLAQVEAYRQKRLNEPHQVVEPFQPGPFVRTYELDWTRIYAPKRPVLIIPEDMP